MSQDQNFVTPMGEIGGEMIAPSNFENRTKLASVQMLPHGNNLGIVYGIIDLGTHMESFEGKAAEPKRKIKIMFEHPQLKQRFYEEDVAPRSTVSSFEGTYNTGPKSKVRALIHAVEGRAITDKDAYSYPLNRLLGARVNVIVQHTPKKSDPNSFYEKVTGVTSAQGMIIPADFHPENPYLYFYIDKDGNNFRTKNFADLPFFFRKQIMESDEGKAYAARGGKFAEHPRQDSTAPQGNIGASPMQQQQAPQPQAPVQPAAVILKDPTYTLEQWYQQGWSNEQLVQAGHAVWNTPAPSPTPAPAPATPAAPSTPSAPSPSAASAPSPVAPTPDTGVAGGFFSEDDEKDDLPF